VARHSVNRLGSARSLPSGSPANLLAVQGLDSRLHLAAEVVVSDSHRHWAQSLRSASQISRLLADQCSVSQRHSSRIHSLAKVHSRAVFLQRQVNHQALLKLGKGSNSSPTHSDKRVMQDSQAVSARLVHRRAITPLPAKRQIHQRSVSRHSQAATSLARRRPSQATAYLTKLRSLQAAVLHRRQQTLVHLLPASLDSHHRQQHLLPTSLVANPVPQPRLKRQQAQAPSSLAVQE